MRLGSASFSNHLNEGLKGLYHLFGAETLLVEESLDLLRRAAREQGFNERVRYTVEAGFDWNQLFSSSQSMSLFAEKKLIELRIPTGKPGDAGSKALIEYAANLQGDDTVLVVISGAIEKRAQNTKWFKALDEVGVTVECPLIPAGKLPVWIEQRLRSRGLQFEPEAVQRISHLVEGNLLAAAQEIDLLTLLAKDGKVTAEVVDNAIADHARFNIYSFVDACLAGSSHRCTRILQSLRRDKTEPILVLWALTRETRTLCHLAAASEQGMNPQTLFKTPWHMEQSCRHGQQYAAPPVAGTTACAAAPTGSC